MSNKKNKVDYEKTKKGKPKDISTSEGNVISEARVLASDVHEIRKGLVRAADVGKIRKEIEKTEAGKQEQKKK